MTRSSATCELTQEFPNQIIRASAGTGKTFSLSNRYLRLLVSGCECQTILATTFTRKGAGEILDRIMKRLSDAALDEKAAHDLSEEIEWKLTQEEAATILHNLLRNLHRLEVSTLDSFFNRIAKVFALELDLPPAWEIVDEQTMARMQATIVQDVLEDDSVITLLHLLSKGEAVRGVAAMIQNTVNSIYQSYRESGPEPWDRLRRRGRFLSDEELETVIERIHQFQPEKKSLANQWCQVNQLVDAGDWDGLVKLKSFKNVMEGNNKFFRAVLPDEVIDIYQQLRPHCVAFFENRLIQQNHATRDLLHAFGLLLESRKSATGQLRFDDITQRLEPFAAQFESDRMAFRMDRQVQHLLLDEFQDTSLAQWNVIRPFAKAVTQSPDDARSFFCVGDLKQAIFGWRGGIAEIFDRVDEELPNLADPEKRADSWRSAPTVIELVNEVFLNLNRYTCNDPVGLDAVHQWGDWFEEHSTHKKELQGHVTMEMASDEVPPGAEELKATALRRRNVLDQTIERVVKLTQTLPPHYSIGVIARENKDVAQIVFQLQKRGIDASEEGGSLLTDSAAVELILSALTLADQPSDSIARFHLSHSPLASTFGLQPESEDNQKENQQAAVRASAELRHQIVFQGIGPTVERLAQLLKTDCTERELIRLQQLIRGAYAESLHRPEWQLRPKQFVQFIQTEFKVGDQSDSQVRVLTVHKSKGLEFDAVVLPMIPSDGWGGRSTPAILLKRENPSGPVTIATRYAGKEIRSMIDPVVQTMAEDNIRQNTREAMCVLYVALTRAVHATHIIVPHASKRDAKSPVGVLLSTLCPEGDLERGILYERGNAKWYQAAASSPKHTQKDDDPFNLKPFYPSEDRTIVPTVRSESQSGRGIKHQQPSAVENNGPVLLRDLLETTSQQNAMARGEAIHRCLQQVQWLDEATPSRAALISQLGSAATSADDASAIVDAFESIIQQNNVRSLLSRTSYQKDHLPIGAPSDATRVEVKTERTFAITTESGLLQGAIDRLVLIFEGDRLIGADVIDFKTDVMEDSERDSRIDAYRHQLEEYRKAASQFLNLPLDTVFARLVFTDRDEVVRLDQPTD